MAALKKLVGVYLIIVAVVVAVFFIINTFLVDTLDVPSVWHVLDVLMLIGLALSLIHNYSRKRSVDASGDNSGLSRPYFEANAAFYVTAA